MSVSKIFHSLQNELKGSKPGIKAQLKMSTHPRPGHTLYQKVQSSSVQAGVLLVLYPKKKGFYLVLTRRTRGMYHHQSQISFPGGRREKGESFEQAALRETKEELGIPPEYLRIVGRLTPLYIPPSNHCIHPVVSVTEKSPPFRPSPDEVSEVIEIPVNHLLDEKNVYREVWNVDGNELKVPFYLYKGNKIWGATAMVLAEMLEIWKRIKSKK
ncbi:CoA pyrophosphatase [bacterium]|nr:CoA pyrophosphatase [bacterium]